MWLAERACPSPALSLLVRQRGAAAGVMITASHNPPRWNGVKFKASYGSSALPSMVAEVEKELAVLVARGVPALPGRARSEIQPLDILTPYLETIDKLVDWQKLKAAKLRFVSDPMHGSARGLLAGLLHRHGISCDEIRGTRDPLFGGVNPEPIEAEHRGAARSSASREIRCFGPSPRTAMATASARWTVTARSSIPTRFFPSSSGTWRVRGNCPATWPKRFPPPSCWTRSPSDSAARSTAKCCRSDLKYICELMLERDILLGGEESGGIGTSLYLPERDATVSALLLAEVMAWHGKSLGELVAELHARIRRGEHHYRARGPGAASGAEGKRRWLTLARRNLQAAAGLADRSSRRSRDGIEGVSWTAAGWVLVRVVGHRERTCGFTPETPRA